MLERLKRDASLLRWVCIKTSALALLVISFAGGGCTTAWVQERRLAPTGLASQDAIAVVLSSALPLRDEQPSELENKVTGCIQDALSQAHPDIRLIFPKEFRKLAFPDLTLDQIPWDFFSWQSVLRDPTFHDRIAPLGLRYVLAVNTEEGSRLTDVEWTAATSMLGGPGPTLSASWDNSVLMQTIVVDARHRRVAGAVQAYANGKSGAGLSLVKFPVPFLLPHGMPSFPFGVVCRGLGKGLAKFLTDELPEQAQAPSP